MRLPVQSWHRTVSHASATTTRRSVLSPHLRRPRHTLPSWHTVHAYASAGDSSSPPSAAKVVVTETQTRKEDPAQVSGEEQQGLLPSLGHELESEGASKKTGPIVALLSGLGIAFLLGGGYVFKDQIKAFLDLFISMVDEYGPWGYAAYGIVYIGLEVLALPAIPLTMTAGVIFGTNQGTMIVSVASTIAATIAFLIARYLARDKVRGIAYKHPKFKAIDRAIGRNGLKFVTLLRLSPLLPLAASNYLYGLTSVDLGSYVLGSWIGMLPGTYAYVHAGALGRAVLEGGEGTMTIDTWQVALGLVATLFALGFIGRLAKNAVEEADNDPPAPAATTPQDTGAAPPTKPQ